MHSNKIINIRKYKPMLLLVGSLFFITACGQAASNENQEEESHYSLPEIVPKYDAALRTEFSNRVSLENANRYEGLVIPKQPILKEPSTYPKQLIYDSGIDIPYPEDGVKGIYLTAANVANTEFFDEILTYIDQTELNAVVIDFKDDWGNIVTSVETGDPLIDQNSSPMIDFDSVMQKLEQYQIYPIARVVTFKDNTLAELRPDLSFTDTETGLTWTDGNGSTFINPFVEETWNYNVTIAEEAAKIGFKDIQFDYIRFPEGFETFNEQLEYNIGDYAAFISDDPELDGIERVAAINDFLTYAENRLTLYGVQISADVFGFTAIASAASEVRGIGQDFTQMAQRVDVVSSMIYPSHWGPGFFGYDYPDLYPYEIVKRYVEEEEFVLSKVENNVKSRPWIQDFTADYLAWGTYLVYGANEVQAQINALYDSGYDEYLLWNATGLYTSGVDYSPDY